MTTQGHAAAMRHCIAQSCEGGRVCRTPMQCSGAAALVDESIDHFRLHRLQAVEAIEARWTEPRPTVYLAPGVIQGQDDDDFLREGNALTACIRWLAAGFGLWLLICAIAGFIARYFGWL